MIRLPVKTWIGNAAAVLCGDWGAVARQAKEAGCSRQIAYKHAERVARIVAEQQPGGPSREELLRQNQELRDENRQLWDAMEQSVDFPEEKQQRFVATATAMGRSSRTRPSALMRAASTSQSLPLKSCQTTRNTPPPMPSHSPRELLPRLVLSRSLPRFLKTRQARRASFDWRIHRQLRL